MRVAMLFGTMLFALGVAHCGGGATAPQGSPPTRDDLRKWAEVNEGDARTVEHDAKVKLQAAGADADLMQVALERCRFASALLRGAAANRRDLAMRCQTQDKPDWTGAALQFDVAAADALGAADDLDRAGLPEAAKQLLAEVRSNRDLAGLAHMRAAAVPQTQGPDAIHQYDLAADDFRQEAELARATESAETIRQISDRAAEASRKASELREGVGK
jgi:hypothetical protein